MDHQALLAELQRQHGIDWSLCCVNGSSVRALTAAGGLRRGRGEKNTADTRGLPAPRATRSRPGASRGGSGSKLHLLCDWRGVVLACRVTAGQRAECTEFESLLESLLESVAVPGSGGTPHRRPRALAGEKGYPTRAIRRWCHRHHVQAVIPERHDQIAQRAHRPGRRPTFLRDEYRARNIIERVIGWLKRPRRIAARAEKLAVRYASMVTLALIVRTVILFSGTP
jgi:transposase